MGATLTFGVADVRLLASEMRDEFDVVLACDNALPHLLTQDELRQGVGAMHARLADGGLFLASIRDYDTLLEQRPTGEPPRMFERPEGRQVTVQAWDWDTRAPIYTVHQFIVRERGEAWEARHYQARYRALRRAELTAILHEVGFEDVRWRMPAESGYYQPIVTARR